jgi:dTDP-L-rhamnose 4-epimerase
VRVLVTGGAGFIGSHIVDALLSRGHEAVVVDRRPRPWWRDDVEGIVGDVRDPDVWSLGAAGVDAVCHQAARVGLGVDPSDVRDYVADNDEGTAAGLWALARLGFAGRLVLASSMVVYGEGRYRCPRHGEVRPGPRSADDLATGRFDHRCARCDEPLDWLPIDEDAALDPRNVYAATKLHQEHLGAVWGREVGVPVTALRYHNVYGPRCPRDTPYAGVTSLFTSAVARGESPRVFEDGAQVRDFVHVADVARANVLALEVAEPYVGALNVASGTPRTVFDVAVAICGDSGLTPAVVGGGRVGDVRHVVASAARATAVLGFDAVEPFTPAAVAP